MQTYKAPNNYSKYSNVIYGKSNPRIKYTPRGLIAFVLATLSFIAVCFLSFIGIRALLESNKYQPDRENDYFRIKTANQNRAKDTRGSATTPAVSSPRSNSVLLSSPNFHCVLERNSQTSDKEPISLKSAYFNRELHVLYEWKNESGIYTRHLSTKDFLNWRTVIANVRSGNSFQNVSSIDFFKVFPQNILPLLTLGFTTNNAKRGLMTFEAHKNVWKINCNDCVSEQINPGTSVTWSSLANKWIGLSRNGHNLVYSNDLKTWANYSEIVSKSPLNESITEMFNVYFIGNKTMFSKWVFCYTGTEKTCKFVKTKNHNRVTLFEKSKFKMDYATDLQSISVCPYGQWKSRKRFLIGYLKNPYIKEEILSIPRYLTLERFAGGFRLVQKPVVKSICHRSKVYSINMKKNVSLNHNITFGNVHTHSFFITGNFEVGTATTFGFKIVRSSHITAVETSIGYNSTSKNYFLTRVNPRDYHASKSIRYETFSGNSKWANRKVTFQVIADVSIIEVFCNRGDIVFSILDFPIQISDNVDIFVNGGYVKVKKVKLRKCF